MTFLDFMRERFGGSWAVCRKTPRAAARYGRCVTPKEFAQAERDYARQYPETFVDEYGWGSSLMREVDQLAAPAIRAARLDAIKRMAA